MSTIVYLPMPEWQALSFMRNREDAFRRLLTPLGNDLSGEVVFVDDFLVGFKSRDNAVEAARERYPQGFAMLRIYLGKLQFGSMKFLGQLVSDNHPETGDALWKINRDGVEFIREKTETRDVEILLDEIFGPNVPERYPIVDSIYFNDGPAQGLFGAGPTGFGGC